jgi:hypothetical protein
MTARIAVGTLVMISSACCAALVMTLSSCSTGVPAERDVPQEPDVASGIRYSIVCIIHGDGDYGYHDTAGGEHAADEEAVAGAQRIAQQNPLAEVFIFHQKSRDHILFLFPRHDGEFLYYRNGRLVVQESYWRDEGLARFDTEAEFYRRFHTADQPRPLNVFLYFGHEIPEAGGEGYDASYPNRPFTVHDLEGGLREFTHNADRFDLLVLSTCFGGTPYTIGALGAYARYIIASPDNLHLSYFDTGMLEHLERTLHDRDVHAFARNFARHAFDRLTKDVQTAVSVAVYDVDRVEKFVRSVHAIYDHTLAAAVSETQASTPVLEHCDCADLPAYVQPEMTDGVEVLFRPARFGRSANKHNHSGWECWKKK